MVPSRARWKIGQAEEAAANELSARLGVDRIVGLLLVSRGIVDREEASRFLNADVNDLHDPYELDGMREAVQRIREGLAKGEKIRIYGDYDADGVSSTALMSRLFRSLGANFDTYIPHRATEGYGLNRAAMDRAAEAGVSLIVTVDTGISAREEIAYARELGMDVVVTDHHEPPAELPEAIAVVNPKKPGCPYPYKQLAGAGVAFKLAQALLDRIPAELFDIAAIGTVGDLMPLTDENRIIVKQGIERMRTGSYAGIKALFDVADVDKRTMNAGHIGFALAPRINASGRLDAADPALQLLTTDDPEEAAELALRLDLLNRERQRIVDEIAAEALLLAAEQKTVSGGVLVVAKEGWNVGVIGIVASKLLERFYCPTVVLSIDPETGLAKGSARSIAGFDMYEALTGCGDLMEHYGGHQAAAGMTLEAGNISEFRERLGKFADEWLTEADYQPILNADLECALDGSPLGWIKELEQLAPFGAGNPAPRFVFRDLRIMDMKTMGKDNRHMKLQVAPWTATENRKPIVLDAVGFSKGSMLNTISSTDRIELLGELTLNEWNGSVKPQILIQDLSIPEMQVFDFRGAGLTDSRWKSLALPDASLGVVLFTPEDADKVPAELKEAATLWLWEGNREPKLLQEPVKGKAASSGLSYEELQSLVLLTLPPSLEALRAALRQAREAGRLYPVFLAPTDEAGMPSRDMFVQIYSTLRKEGTAGQRGIDPVHYLSRRAGLSASHVRFILDVFEELELVEQASGDYRCTVSPAKRDLTESGRYQDRLRFRQVEEELLYSTAKDLTRLLKELRDRKETKVIQGNRIDTP
ncbi:single-stranded-DNA-specific exonuclease RecJ [Gorillibacterium timonense]|uniref:single-stranded-DNA-specific exonuclease RecJ n=1 Tax=Gorillibacterium timonense TaxID=1689269 RepID=UPI00071DF41F|nr:single-stranded-DNA-specific exonuclease RecJ [Gorillibacterium timonense]